MAEKSMYFNDADYLAADWAKQWDLILTDGVHVTNGQMGLRVVPSAGLKIGIETGYAYIKGYMYINDTVLEKELDAADTALDRIDRIVLRLDVANQEIRMRVKKGTFGSNPVLPELIDGELLKELPIARIRINANSSTPIITDERIPISSLLDIPFQDILSDWENFKGDKESDYSTWLATLQNLLDESVAGNLLGLIDDNADEIEYLQTEKMDNSKIKLSTLDADVNAMNDGDIWIKYGDA